MTRIEWVVRRFGELDGRRRWLVCEAWMLLAVARVSLRLIPVRRILVYLDRRKRAVRERGGLASEAGRMEVAREVRWAILVAARRSPVRFVCFPQCISGSIMLDRRGICSVLHYGVSRVDGGLLTHTWLQAGEDIVIGGEVADEFSLLSSF